MKTEVILHCAGALSSVQNFELFARADTFLKQSIWSIKNTREFDALKMTKHPKFNRFKHSKLALHLLIYKLMCSTTYIKLQMRLRK